MLMTAFLENIEFARPWFLWLLCVLPLLWLRLRDRRLIVLLARTVIAALLILTLADPQSVREKRETEEIIFAYDLSQSISGSFRGWMSRITEELAPTRQDRIFVFGADAKVVRNLSDAGLSESKAQTNIDGQRTNLENLLSKLMELPAAPRNLVLFTDGWQTAGDVERLLPAAAAAGLKIYPMLPPERQPISNIAVTKLLAPTQGNSGENLNLRVVLENQNDHPVEGSLVIKRNGQEFKTERLKLPPGSQTFSHQSALENTALNVFQASFTSKNAADDRFNDDNQALAWVTVRLKAKVLLINGRSGAGRYLEEIIKRQGFDVTVHTPESAPPPAGFKIIIFNNAEREKFSSGYLSTIERAVSDGAGFIMLGADNSFAPTSYRQTPIEKLLPLEPKEPPKPEEKTRAVVLVIDKSGSMRDENRIVYAKEAAKAVARQLKDNDMLGIVGFDDKPFVVMYLDTLARIRGRVDTQIDRLKPGGQTYFFPAIREARQQLERANASRKHIILLSDGMDSVARTRQGELIGQIIDMKNDSKIITSTVAISSEADVSTLKRMSKEGGGLFHHILDPSTLPKIVLEQLQDQSKEEPRDNRPLIPIQGNGSDLLAGFAAKNYPAVLGYMETELKKGASLDLLIPRDDRRAPLLASWRYGRGKVIALTTDLEGRWSRNWISWNGLQSFWARLFEWLVPTQANLVPAHEARVSVVGDRAVLDLSVFEDSGASSQYAYSISGKGTKLIGNLARLADGHYQATLPITQSGEYRIDLSENRAGRVIGFPPIGYSFPNIARGEVPRPEFNTKLLTRMAEATGGEINPKSFENLSKTRVLKDQQPLRNALIVLAACLFFIELAMRKFALGEPD